MRKFFEFFQLLYINFKVDLFEGIEQLKVMKRYYSNKEYANADKKLLRDYLFQSPFKICKKFLTEKGSADIYAYGETPLTSFENIIRECGVTKEDRVLELGAGRGRLCLWLHFFTGCEVWGIEEVPLFVKRAQSLQIPKIHYICGDYLEVPFPKVNVVFLYGTNLEREVIFPLIKKIKQLGKGTRVITVTFPLNDYDSDFQVEKTFQAQFPWGRGDIYLNLETVVEADPLTQPLDS